MKRRKAFVRSSLDWTETGIRFTKVFSVRKSAVLPSFGTPIPPGCFTARYGQLGIGSVIRLTDNESLENGCDEVLAMEMPGTTDELWKLLKPEGWDEVSGPTE